MDALYLHSKQGIRKRRPRSPRALLWMALGLLLLSLALVCTRWIQQQTALRVGRQFDSAWLQKDFVRAHSIYQQIDGGLEKADWQAATGVYARLRTKADTMIRDAREAFLRRLSSGSFAWEKGEKAFFAAFETENTQYLHDYMMTICNDIMMDKQQPEWGRNCLQVLRQISGQQHEADQVEALLPHLHSFSQQYQKAISTQDFSQQVRLFRSMQNSISDPLFDSLRQFFATQEKRAAESWKKQWVSILQTLWDQGRYYTVQKRVEDWLELLPDDAEAKTWQEKVDHQQLLGTHLDPNPLPVFVLQSVVADPARAMQSSRRTYYMQNVLPEASVQAMLQSLYDRGFVLIDPEAGMQQTGRIDGIRVPEGKKPVLLVVEGMNYLPDRSKTGGFQTLHLDAEGGRISTWLDANGALQQGRDGDVTGIVDRFVQDHPDFAFDGARGMIILDSEEPFFGTIATQRQLRNVNARLAEEGGEWVQPEPSIWEEGAKQVQALAQNLRAQGWSFAWTFRADMDFAGMTMVEWEQEIAQRQKSVESLLGPVQGFAFPPTLSMGNEDRRFQLLFEQGLHVFLEAGEGFATPHSSQPLRLVTQQVNALTFYFRRQTNYFDPDACYRGIIAAKMYDPPKKKGR